MIFSYLIRNLPRANVIGVLIVTIVYLLTNISYLVVLSADGLLNSSAVAVVCTEVSVGSLDVWFRLKINTSEALFYENKQEMKINHKLADTIQYAVIIL